MSWGWGLAEEEERGSLWYWDFTGSSDGVGVRGYTKPQGICPGAHLQGSGWGLGSGDTLPESNPKLGAGKNAEQEADRK